MKNIWKIILITLLYSNLIVAEQEFENFLPIGKTDYGYSMRDFDLDSTGKMYVLSGDFVYKLDLNGKMLKKWDTDLGFYHSVALAIDKKLGFVYVAADDERIRKYDLNGNYILEWDNIYDINDIAVDNQGRIYSSGNDYIKKYTNDGTPLNNWGGAGNSNGRFNDIGQIVIDKQNNVYAVDKANGRIQKFSSSGSFITKWDSYLDSGSTKHFDFTSSGAIGVDNNMRIYVEVYYDGIQIFDKNGNYLDNLKSKGSGVVGFDGQGGAENFGSLASIKTDTYNIYIAHGGFNHGRIDKYNLSKEHITSFGHYSAAKGEFRNPQGIATDNEENIYVVDKSNNRIQKFNNKGVFIKKWGGFGTTEGKFDSPTYIAINNLNEVYVCDSSNERVQKFTSNGNFLLSWSVSNSSLGYNMATDNENSVYLCMRENNQGKIVKYSSTGTFIKQWMLDDYCGGLAYNKKNNHLFSVLYSDEVIEFSVEGNEVSRWGRSGLAEGELYDSTGITSDKDGNLFIIGGHYDDQSIQKFTAGGVFKYRWTSDAFGTHQFETLTGITSDEFGNIFIVDNGGLYTSKAGIKQLYPDVDNDGILNYDDAFPFNPNESTDSDHDGIGNNTDTDDDNDGISDSLEKANGLNPLNPADAQADFDHDGFSNVIEISVGTNIRSASSKPTWAPIMMGNIMIFIPSAR